MDETTEERIMRRLNDEDPMHFLVGHRALARVLAEELERLDERYARREHGAHSRSTLRYR